MPDRLRDRVVGRLSSGAYGAGWAGVKLLRPKTAERLFDRGARWAYKKNGPGVQQLRKNLRRVVGPDLPEPELDAIVEQSLRNYARYWREAFRLPTMDHREVAAIVDRAMIGAEHIDKARAEGRGYVVPLPHMGNWDAAGVWLVDHYNEGFTTVAERLKPESLYDRFVAYRESLGFEILPERGGERPPAEVLAERLKAGKGVCLVADRDLSRRGIEVDFFGEKTRFPAGPAHLAATTGAALLPATVWFTEDGWAQKVEPEIVLPPELSLAEKVQYGTQKVADAFAAGIAEHPADWHMLQKLWLSDLTPRPAG